MVLLHCTLTHMTGWRGTPSAPARGRTRIGFDADVRNSDDVMQHQGAATVQQLPLLPSVILRKPDDDGDSTTGSGRRANYNSIINNAVNVYE